MKRKVNLHIERNLINPSSKGEDGIDGDIWGDTTCLKRMSLRIDNSRRGAIHVLWDISRTKIVIKSCDRSNERAYFSACVGRLVFLMKFDLKKRQI